MASSGFLNKDVQGNRAYFTSAFKDTDGKPTTRVQVGSSDIQQPTDVQARYQKTVQTHNSVTIAAASSAGQASYMDVSGFENICLTGQASPSEKWGFTVYWSNDGAAVHGVEFGAVDVMNNKTLILPIKARWVKVNVNNGATNSATVNAWAYLKV
jgi:hypothetical protein